MSTTRKLVAALAVVVLAASCAQSNPGGSGGQKETEPVATPSGPKPAPFDKGTVKIAVVRQSGAGDYFEAWGQGAQRQAKAVGIELEVTDARNDNAKQASDLERAISSKPDAIIVDHGQKDTIEPLVRKAVKAGIPTAVYDLDLDRTEGVVVTSQNDKAMASQVLDKLVEDVGDKAKVGYVSATGFAPLDRRAEVWRQVVKEHQLDQVFSTGKVTESTATDNVPLVDAALKQHPETQAIFAPYDEITKGTVQAVTSNDLGDKVKVYGIDISNADIDAMTAQGSPWVATAATDAAEVGAAVVRTTALEVAGKLKKDEVQFPAALITQDFLRDNDVTDVGQLAEKNDTLVLDKVSVAPWLPHVA